MHDVHPSATNCKLRFSLELRSRGQGNNAPEPLVPALPLMRRNYISTSSSPSPSSSSLMSSLLSTTSTGRTRAPPFADVRPLAEAPPRAGVMSVSARAGVWRISLCLSAHVHQMYNPVSPVFGVSSLTSLFFYAVIAQNVPERPLASTHNGPYRSEADKARKLETAFKAHPSKKWSLRQIKGHRVY